MAAIRVDPIPKKQADELIKTGHYSKSVVWSSSVHLGVYLDGELIGVLQFGPAMNPASGGRVVQGASKGSWLELNRMWLRDNKPPNSTSQAVARSLDWLKRNRPEIEWIQSFADSRCHKAGGIYQACSFLYLGSHKTTFYELDGEWFHKSMVGRKEYDKRGWWCGPKISRFNANRERAVPHVFTQYRYFKALRRGVENRLLLPALPYPKPDKDLATAATPCCSQEN